MTSRRVLVTGGAGFLGSYLARSYLASGSSVLAVGHLKRGSPQPPRMLSNGLEFVELELCDSRQLEGAFSGRDLVIHAAAMTHARNAEERRLQERSNVEATLNIIEGCRICGVPRLLHISSTAAIGISPDSGEAPADETFNFNLGHLGLSYNTSKHQAERLVLEANGPMLETLVVNPGFVFGRHQGRFKGEEVIARALKRSVVVCTDGGLSIVHVEDVVDGIRRAVEKGRAGERYILSGDNLSFLEIAEVVRRIAGRKNVLLSLPKFATNVLGFFLNSLSHDPGKSRNLLFDCRYAYQFYNSQKARLALGYRPRSFDQIVADYLNFTRTRWSNEAGAEGCSSLLPYNKGDCG